MRWTLVAACIAVVAGLWLPGEAAQPASAPSVEANADTITFEQYRDWRLNFIERRRSELAMRLGAPDLAESQKSRLRQVKAYYDWLAALPDAERDRGFRERFDRIDANHDGKIDAGERAAWHDKQRAFYRSDRVRPAPAAAAASTEPSMN